MNILKIYGVRVPHKYLLFFFYFATSPDNNEHTWSIAGANDKKKKVKKKFCRCLLIMWKPDRALNLDPSA